MTKKEKIELTTEIIRNHGCGTWSNSIIECRECPLNKYCDGEIESIESAKAYLKTLL